MHVLLADDRGRISPGQPLRKARSRWSETNRNLTRGHSAHLPMARMAISTLGRYSSETRYSSRVGGSLSLFREGVLVTWIFSTPGAYFDHLQ